MKLNYAIVFVSDMKKSVAFYRDVLGIPLKYETPYWTEFATDGATLALHSDKGDQSAGVDLQPESPGHCRPGLAVTDLDAFHEKMIEHGVVCVQEPKETFGARLAQYTDPDGLTISVAEEKRNG